MGRMGLMMACSVLQPPRNKQLKLLQKDQIGEAKVTEASPVGSDSTACYGGAHRKFKQHKLVLGSAIRTIFKKQPEKVF